MGEIALIGNGYLGQAYSKMFPDALIYDEPKEMYAGQPTLETGRLAVNQCEMSIVAVPTDPLPNGELDMGIVDDVVGWLETPDILIKSALQPGTVDRLVEETGKNIAVSVEFVGMGKYYTPHERYPDPENPQMHDMLIVGGELGVATRCAERLWRKMSPDIRIHLLTANEAEICKLIENAWGAFKVTWANCMYSVIDKSAGNFVRTHQAWTSDGRVDAMHTRVISTNRGWKSHCYDKDIPALAAYSDKMGAEDMAELLRTVLKINQGHLEENENIN